jgi:hypothetical protein
MLPWIFHVLAAAAGATIAPPSAAAAAREQLGRCGPAEATLAKLPDTAWVSSPGAMQDHRLLRQALGEAMPIASTMILVHAHGGDLASTEFSIVVTRGDDGAWHGTAVGRTQIWIPDTPPTILPRKAWTLSADNGRRLDAILDDRCLYAEPGDFHGKDAPAVGALGFQVDIVTPSHWRQVFFYGGEALGLTREVVTLSQPPE